MRISLMSLAAITLVFATSSSVAAQPPAPSLVSPSGLIDGAQTYSWHAVAGATWYQLWVSDSVSHPKVLEWYTATQAGCAEATGMCSVHLKTDLAEGAVSWWVRGYNAGGNGPWSPTSTAYLRTPGAWSIALPVAARYQQVLGGAAVLDRETGLVWQRTPGGTTINYTVAVSGCINLTIGGRRGWRVPTFHELSSLAGQDGVSALPTGHPFILGALAPAFWSQSNFALTTDLLVGNFTGATLLATAEPATDTFRIWCVRGPASAER